MPDKTRVAQTSIEFSSLQEIAAQNGLRIVSVACRSSGTDILSQHRPFLQSWQEQGFAADMHFMLRSPDLLCNPDNLLLGWQTIVSFAVSYSNQVPGPVPTGFARVARYAWGKDYHRVLARAFKQVVLSCRELVGSDFPVRTFQDAVPLLERSLAAGSSSGGIGKNSMFIQPGIGSWMFIAEMITELEVSDVPARFLASGQESPTPGTICKSCSRCIDRCPTQAIVGDGVVDSRLCISWLTIEKSGGFDDWQRRAIGSWVFGCDICQEVCPFNHRQVSSPERNEFLPEPGSGPTLELSSILKLSTPEAFLKRFAGTALMRAGREKLLRNALAVIGNQGDCSLIEQVRQVSGSDPSAMVRSEAAICLARIEGDCAALSMGRKCRL